MMLSYIRISAFCQHDFGDVHKNINRQQQGERKFRIAAEADSRLLPGGQGSRFKVQDCRLPAGPEFQIRGSMFEVDHGVGQFIWFVWFLLFLQFVDDNRNITTIHRLVDNSFFIGELKKLDLALQLFEFGVFMD